MSMLYSGFMLIAFCYAVRDQLRKDREDRKKRRKPAHPQSKDAYRPRLLHRFQRKHRRDS
ncbi:hypothetical protein [Dyella silvatica]|uniref:hypothetical protein n=1 Tax=Dyella silvatica TaxID=2992128 RepID=UPI002251971F|nr:hypothetical protein [Dyella silvatica]